MKRIAVWWKREWAYASGDETFWDRLHSTMVFVLFLIFAGAAVNAFGSGWLGALSVAFLFVYMVSLKHLGDNLYLSSDPGIEKL